MPGVAPGRVYKYHVVSRVHGYTVDKADPFGVRHEVPPRTGSVVWDLDYAWGDADWMADARASSRFTSRRCRSTRSTWARGAACPTRATAR